MKHFVLVVDGVENSNVASSNIIFTFKNTKQSYMFQSSLYQQQITKTIKKTLSNVFERYVYWNEYKTKSENNYRKNEYRYFLESQFGGVSRLLALIYLNKGDDDAKRYKARSYFFYQNVLLRIITSSSTEKNRL